MNKAVKIGIIAGILCGSAWLLNYVKGSSSNEGTSYSFYLSFILYFLSIFLAIQQTRDKELGGSITFRVAFRTGIKTSFFIAVIWSLINVSYYLIADKQTILDANPQLTQETLEKALGSVFLFRLFLSFSASLLLAGTLFSLITSGILKRQREVQI